MSDGGTPTWNAINHQLSISFSFAQMATPTAPIPARVAWVDVPGLPSGDSRADRQCVEFQVLQSDQNKVSHLFDSGCFIDGHFYSAPCKFADGVERLGIYGDFRFGMLNRSENVFRGLLVAHPVKDLAGAARADSFAPQPTASAAVAAPESLGEEPARSLASTRQVTPVPRRRLAAGASNPAATATQRPALAPSTRVPVPTRPPVATAPVATNTAPQAAHASAPPIDPGPLRPAVMTPLPMRQSQAKLSAAAPVDMSGVPAQVAQSDSSVPSAAIHSLPRPALRRLPASSTMPLPLRERDLTADLGGQLFSFVQLRKCSTASEQQLRRRFIQYPGLAGSLPPSAIFAPLHDARIDGRVKMEELARSFLVSTAASVDQYLDSDASQFALYSNLQKVLPLAAAFAGKPKELTANLAVLFPPDVLRGAVFLVELGRTWDKYIALQVLPDPDLSILAQLSGLLRAVHLLSFLFSVQPVAKADLSPPKATVQPPDAGSMPDAWLADVLVASIVLPGEIFPLPPVAEISSVAVQDGWLEPYVIGDLFSVCAERQELAARHPPPPGTPETDGTSHADAAGRCNTLLAVASSILAEKTGSDARFGFSSRYGPPSAGSGSGGWLHVATGNGDSCLDAARFARGVLQEAVRRITHAIHAHRRGGPFSQTDVGSNDISSDSDSGGDTGRSPLYRWFNTKHKIGIVKQGQRLMVAMVAHEPHAAHTPGLGGHGSPRSSWADAADFALRRFEIAHIRQACLRLLLARCAAMAGVPNEAGTAQQARMGTDQLRFFDEMLEWDEMTYQFHHHVTGNGKHAQPDRVDAQESPLDAFFAADLAEVMVPVRPSQETALLHCLSFGRMWRDDTLCVSVCSADVEIVNDLKSAAQQQMFAAQHFCAEWEIAVPSGISNSNNPR